MKWIETVVIIKSESPEMALDLVSGLFMEFCLQGVVIEEPGRDPFADWGEDAIESSDRYAVKGYFPKDDKADLRLDEVRERLAGLSEIGEFSYEIEYTEVDEEDWAESWKEFFWPEKISERIVVKPTWREYEAQGDDIIIEIDPGMAFGTGAHPTTALCIRMLEKHLKADDSILDVGTGSGILLAASAKLGAGFLHGTDIDDVAVIVARENLLLNKVPETSFLVEAGDLVDKISRQYDVAVANILAEVVVRLLDNLPARVKDGGLMIFSGIITERMEMVLEKIRTVGLEVIEVMEDGGWVAICAKKS
ncbi:50S ribosomal protein L11 methyltransferase [Desulforegula conservatrix]|uniref:50S ribosomal protein L11 methyltransferase n=1 Tax=Desulforegula conservatrix TaxID=153026 RepID=UPI00040023D6|nr:50S ribosomal protein L11 methyltransferase [Desulforegula conservatrix]